MVALGSLQSKQSLERLLSILRVVALVEALPGGVKHHDSVLLAVNLLLWLGHTSSPLLTVSLTRWLLLLLLRAIRVTADRVVHHVHHSLGLLNRRLRQT